MTVADRPPVPSGTAMCECAHHWRMHSASGWTAPGAVCWGTHGSATPGPYEPCDCKAFAPWSGPTDARTGEPVKPLTMAADARVTTRSDAEAAFLAASVAVWREIDRLGADPESYRLTKAERAAWERYRDEIGGSS